MIEVPATAVAMATKNGRGGADFLWPICRCLWIALPRAWHTSGGGEVLRPTDRTAVNSLPAHKHQSAPQPHTVTV
ncbi:hypothetical protein GJAV_G00011330 [Gymnothorax javanicus]|nr:hypothetical protein GJAV_G00011330 [Gymnothorax javanicus]